MTKNNSQMIKANDFFNKLSNSEIDEKGFLDLMHGLFPYIFADDANNLTGLSNENKHRLLGMGIIDARLSLNADIDVNHVIVKDKRAKFFIFANYKRITVASGFSMLYDRYLRKLGWKPEVTHLGINTPKSTIELKITLAELN